MAAHADSAYGRSRTVMLLVLVIGFAVAVVSPPPSNVQPVAAGSDEMGASIREISQNANNAAQVGRRVQATTGALGEADASVAELTRVADELRTVVARFGDRPGADRPDLTIRV